MEFIGKDLAVKGNKYCRKIETNDYNAIFLSLSLTCRVLFRFLFFVERKIDKGGISQCYIRVLLSHNRITARLRRVTNQAQIRYVKVLALGTRILLFLTYQKQKGVSSYEKMCNLCSLFERKTNRTVHRRAAARLSGICQKQRYFNS